MISRDGTPRGEALRAFLADAGLAGAVVRPLAGDASNRRYHRLAEAGAVVMDAPPEANERMDAFVAVTKWLRRAGLSAPEIRAADLDRGFLLLEDLGDDLFARVLEAGRAEEHVLYAAAVDLLADLAAAAPDLGTPAGIRPYDEAALLREVRLAVEWWVPGASGAPLPPDALAEFDALVEDSVAPVTAAREVTVLRDYHAENLIWLPDRPGAARVGLLDYQDALAGHAAYDLVSLLEDARRDTSPELRAAMLARYLDRRGIAPEPFRAALATLGAQRNLKIVGIFARLALRDGKARYLGLIPRVWAHLLRDLAHPDLAALRRFVTRHVPAPEPPALGRIAAQAGEGTPA
jgi:hypothetical protein